MDESRFSAEAKSAGWVIIVALLIIALLIAACGSDGDDAEAEVVACESQAFVDSVKIIKRDGEHYAIVKGNYPDACTKTANIQQKADGDAITVTLCTTQPEGLACAQMLTPFEEEVLLDTGDLDSGTYTVHVNGTKTEFTVD